MKLIFFSSVLGRRTGSRWLEKMCILSVVLAVLRMANNQALLFAGWQSPDRCSVLLNVSIAMYFLALHPVYLFLWIRQVSVFRSIIFVD